MKHIIQEKITLHIKPNSKVLDLGCGNGELLMLLKKEKNITGYGIDLNEENIIKCIKHNIPVFQGNIEEILAEFQSNSYDYVILGETLQETKHTLKVLQESLRIGKKIIVSFPNFGYWKIRLQLLKGQTPETSLLPYKWYETPNIRVLTINDFKQLCKNNHISIIKEINITPSLMASKKKCSNIFSKQGIFILKKK
jgi:methionine biosynthesis protein MetW